MKSPSSFNLCAFAAEEFVDFVRESLPTILTAQARNQAAQVRTLQLLSSLDDDLHAALRHPTIANGRELLRRCEKLSQHIMYGVGSLPTHRQLEYREILQLFMLAEASAGAGP